MTARLLFVHGGPEEARRVFREERRGYWTAALPLVLEKHGLLMLEEVTPDELAEAIRREEVGCALVGRLPATGSSLAAVSQLIDSGRPVLLEGPLAPELHERLGITAAVPVEHEGSVGMGDRETSAAAREYGYQGGGRVALPTPRALARERATDWRVLRVPISDARAAAWRGAGWDAERWSVSGDVQVLATWTSDDGNVSPAVIRRGNVICTSFSLFSVLGQGHTSEPWEHGEYRSGSRTTGLETLLLALIDDLYRRAELVRPRVLPWPRNARWALNVRHDFDRFITAPQVSKVIALHDRVGSAATWYWRSRHLRGGPLARFSKGNEALRLVVAAPHHEVALHTERLFEGAERELAMVERVARQRPLGSSSHGDPRCFRFQGAPNVLWAEEQGLLYTELIEHAHFHPHRFPNLEQDGTISPLSVIMLPHHASLDRSSKGGDGDPGRIHAAGESFEAARGLLQVMNHPDINQEELFVALDGLPRAGRLDWTAAQAIDWWRRTHVREMLAVAPDSPQSFTVTAREAVEELAVELRDPEGRVRTRLLTLEPDQPARLDLGSTVASV